MTRQLCQHSGAHMVQLRAFANGTDVIEEIVYRCGHIKQRVVGHVLPPSHFAEIEQRLFGSRERAA